jgi:hypothetical protein
VLLEVLESEARSAWVSICTVRAMPNASGLPGQETTRGTGGVVVAGADAAASGWADSGAVIGAVVPAATLLAGGTAGVPSGIVGTDVTEAVAVETGATLATVETGSAGGGGLEAVGGLEAGASAATDVGGFKMLIRVSATAAKTAATTIVQAIMMRIGPLRVIHAALSINQAEAVLHAPHTPVAHQRGHLDAYAVLFDRSPEATTWWKLNISLTQPPRSRHSS